MIDIRATPKNNALIIYLDIPEMSDTVCQKYIFYNFSNKQGYFLKTYIGLGENLKLLQKMLRKMKNRKKWFWYGR